MLRGTRGAPAVQQYVPPREAWSSTRASSANPQGLPPRRRHCAKGADPDRSYISRIALLAPETFPHSSRYPYERQANAHREIHRHRHRGGGPAFAPAQRRLSPVARAQNSPKPGPSSPSMAPMDMSDMQREIDQYPEAAKAANDAMSSDMAGMDMSANPHMFMTELQPKQPGDDQRAEEIVEILGKSISRYRDYKNALTDGYQIFLPKVPQPIYHFTNYKNAIAAAFIFNPAHPTSLLYKKTGGRLRAGRRHVHRTEKRHRAAAQRPHPALRGALARTREFLHASQRYAPGAS